MEVLRPRAWRWTTFVKLGCAALVTTTGLAVVAVDPSGASPLALPSVSSISPATGPNAGGSTVLVTGAAFKHGVATVVTSVQFGTARTTDFDVTGRDKLMVTSPPAPPNAKSVDVTVTTSAGTSTTSAADVFTYIPTAPGVPTGVSATVAGSSSAAVSWHLPTTDGGSPITGYSVNNLRSGKLTGVSIKVGVVTSAIVTGLVPGDAYSFSVTAITAIGTTTSAASNLVTMPPASLPFTEGLGYWLAGSTGTVYAHGDAPTLGSLTEKLNAPIVGMAPTPDGNGYWLVASDGGIFAFGTAAFHGSMGGSHLNAPIVGMAAAPDGNGYWLVASDGGIFAFGSAAFRGSMGNKHLNAPIVGMAASGGGGYWLVASDGGIFAFGNATFDGSMGAQHLNQPIVGMAAAPNGGGYWMVASDGGIFSFGASIFHGSMGNQTLNKPIVGMASTPSGNGYWMVASDGGIFTFGDGQFEGSQGATPGLAPVVAIGS